MYTSLMSSALEMAQQANDEILTVDGLQVKVIDRLVDSPSGAMNTTNSILLYTELMRSMVRANYLEEGERREAVLMRIFLAFQGMFVLISSTFRVCYKTHPY